jgi:magnesium-transporting ATPase (P-type)
MRNTVVVSKVGGATHVFVKGSPEVLRGLMQPESIPDDFDGVLGAYTREGYRVLAIAQVGGRGGRGGRGGAAGWAGRARLAGG